jgi:hypothetical protein
MSLILSGDTGVPVTTVTGTLPEANGGTGTTTGYYGFKNRIINSGMVIDQRNAAASQTFTAAAALAYSVDRWYGYCTGANVTGQQIAGTYASSKNRYQFTGAASVTAIGFGQRIEQSNSYDLANTNATLSCYIANSLLTTVTWTASYATTTADTFGSLASPTVTQIATGTFTVTSSRVQYSTTIAIPSAATTGIQIVFTVGAQTSGTWVIDSVQLEKGSTATSFDYRPYGTELALCQRYLPAFNGATVVGSTWGSTATQAYCEVIHIVTPRTAPTGITTSSVATFTIYGSGAVGITPTSLSFNTGGTAASRIGIVTASGLSAGLATSLFANSASSQILFTGCEL